MPHRVVWFIKQEYFLFVFYLFDKNFVFDTKKFIFLRFQSEIENFSSYYHDKHEMFKDIQKVKIF